MPLQTTQAAVGLELWSMSEDIAFDNFIVSTDKSDVDEFASQTWTPKKNAEGGGMAVSCGGFSGCLLEGFNVFHWWGYCVLVLLASCMRIGCIVFKHVCESNHDNMHKNHKKLRMAIIFVTSTLMYCC